MWIDRESEIDLLTFEPFAELITNIVSDTRMNPLTIGLYGSWGGGKSTLLKLIEQKISQLDPTKKRIVCLPLNSWMFEGYDDAKSAIMESLLRTLEENLTASEELKEDILKLVKRVNFIRLASVTIKHGIPLAVSAFNPALAPLATAPYLSDEKRKELFDDMKSVLKQPEDSGKSTVQNIRCFRDEFESLIKKAEIDNLVITVDDLDRCTPERIIQTLEAIKLFLSVSRSTFIIAIDDQVIKYSIEKQYPQLNEDGVKFSDNYLEKIIQLPITIPELSENDLKNYLLLLICELYFTKESLEQIITIIRDNNLFLDGYKIDIVTIEKMLGKLEEKHFKSSNMASFIELFNVISPISDVMACTLKGNPRQAKRFLNTFLTRKSLSEIYYKKSDKIDYRVLVKLLSLEYIDKDLFKELFKWSVINKQKGFIPEFKNITNFVDSSEEFPDEYRKWNDDKIIRWVKAEPTNLYQIDLSPYFYLSRESLDVNFAITDTLSRTERELFRTIKKARPAQRSILIKELNENTGVKSAKILDALIEEFKSGAKIIGIIQDIYITYPAYMGEIKEVIKKYKDTDIPIPATVILNNMYRHNPVEFEDVLRALKKNGVDQKKLDLIKRLPDSTVVAKAVPRKT